MWEDTVGSSDYRSRLEVGSVGRVGSTVPQCTEVSPLHSGHHKSPTRDPDYYTHSYLNSLAWRSQGTTAGRHIR